MIGLIKTQDQAVNYIQDKIIKDVVKFYDLDYIPNFLIFDLNNKRYSTMNIVLKDRTIKYIICFKKEKVHSYGKIYNDEGEGETINKYEFDNNIKDKCERIIYCYQTPYNTEIKYIYVNLLNRLIENKKAYLHNNNADGKQQYIFSVRYLQDFEV